ncbi:MAG: hypothetical protein EOP00_32840 [Pedobacter sp.]|nr:MAG: hypothetical protein EOP00_32840 [Pedobacter sp.]
MIASLVFSVSVVSGIAVAAPAVNNTQSSVSDADKKVIKEQLKSIKSLPADQRKAKMQELKAKYPNAFKNYKNHAGGRLDELAKTNPQLANDLKALKDLPKEQRKARMQELRAKYPDAFKNHKKQVNGKLQTLAKNNPQLANDLKSLRDLPKDQRRAKIQELKSKYLNS